MQLVRTVLAWMVAVVAVAEVSVFVMVVVVAVTGVVGVGVTEIVAVVTVVVVLVVEVEPVVIVLLMMHSEQAHSSPAVKEWSPAKNWKTLVPSDHVAPRQVMEIIEVVHEAE